MVYNYGAVEAIDFLTTVEVQPVGLPKELPAPHRVPSTFPKHPGSAIRRLRFCALSEELRH